MVSLHRWEPATRPPEVPLAHDGISIVGEKRRQIGARGIPGLNYETWGTRHAEGLGWATRRVRVERKRRRNIDHSVSGRDLEVRRIWFALPQSLDLGRVPFLEAQDAYRSRQLQSF